MKIDVTIIIVIQWYYLGKYGRYANFHDIGDKASFLNNNNAQMKT
jgi:hypothetical protein